MQEIDKHLRPYYNAAKRKHRHYRDCAWRCAQKLPHMSVQLKYEKIVFRKGQFSCEFCKKSGPWYELVEDIGHLANKAHRAAAGAFPHRPTDVEVEAWQRVPQGRGGLRTPTGGPGVHRGIRGAGQEAAAAAPAKPLALAPQAEAALVAVAARPRRPSPRRRRPRSHGPQRKPWSRSLTSERTCPRWASTFPPSRAGRISHREFHGQGAGGSQRADASD